MMLATALPRPARTFLGCAVPRMTVVTGPSSAVAPVVSAWKVSASVLRIARVKSVAMMVAGPVAVSARRANPATREAVIVTKAKLVVWPVVLRTKSVTKIVAVLRIVTVKTVVTMGAAEAVESVLKAVFAVKKGAVLATLAMIISSARADVARPGISV